MNVNRHADWGVCHRCGGTVLVVHLNSGRMMLGGHLARAGRWAGGHCPGSGSTFVRHGQ